MARLKSTSLFSDANLKGYWNWNDASFPAPYQNSAGGIDLSPTNSPTVIAGGKYGSAVTFGTGNTNQNIQTGASNFGIDGGSISVVAWVKQLTEIGSGTQTFLSQMGGTVHVEYRLDYNYNGGNRLVQFIRGKIGPGDEGFSYGVSMGTTQFHHLAMTYDGTTVSAYFDGGLVGATSASGTGTTNTNMGFQVGGDIINGATGTKFSSCMIDDIAIFNRALSASEVYTLSTDGHFLSPNKGYW